MVRTSPTKYERLETRIDPELKDLVQHAANLRGEPLTAFVSRALYREAEETITSHHVIRLSYEEGKAFVTMLSEESDPNDNLKRAAEDYKEWVKGITRE